MRFQGAVLIFASVLLSSFTQAAPVSAAPASPLSAAASSASASSTSSAAVGLEARFLEMYDGRWYDPVSGLVAASRSDLVERLARGGSVPLDQLSSSVASVTSVASGLSPPVVSGISTSTTQIATTTTALAGPSLVLALSRAFDLLSATSSKPTTAGAMVALWNSNDDSLRLVFLPSVKRLKTITMPSVEKRDGEIAVGARFALQPLIASKSKKKNPKSVPLEDLIYAPYHAGLRTSETAAFGKQILERLTAEAFSSLQRDAVPSRAIPGKTVAEVINPNLLKSLVMIEHLDRESLIDDPSIAIDRVYVTLAANQGRAYAHVKSPAGALGLAQFMPKTYAKLAADPSNGLIKNFERGMADPVNAMRAQALYLDRVLGELPSDVRGLLDERQAEMEEYLAAAYNGGGTRVRKAVKARGEEWDAPAAATLKTLQAKISKLENELAALKRKLKKATATKTKKTVKNEIAETTTAISSAKKQLAQSKTARLRTETVQYLDKYRIVAPILRTASLAANAVTTTNPGI